MDLHNVFMGHRPARLALRSIAGRWTQVIFFFHHEEREGLEGGQLEQLSSLGYLGYLGYLG